MFPFLVTTAIIPVLIIAAIAVIGFCAYYFNPKQVILRTLSKISTKPISGLRTNELTKVTGKALHVETPLVAPFSKRKCIFYTIEIQQRVSSGKHSRWKTIINEEKVQDFFIDKNGEFVIVKPTQQPRNFISYLVTDKTASSGTFKDASPEFESLLRHYGIDSTGFLGFNKQLRYTEGIIEIGEQITVAGIAKWKNISEPIPEYSYSKIATLESDVKQKLLITDLPIPDAHRQR